MTIIILPGDPAEGNTIPYIGEELTGLPKSGDSQGNVGNQEVALPGGQAGKGGSLQFLRAATRNWLETGKKGRKLPLLLDLGRTGLLAIGGAPSLGNGAGCLIDRNHFDFKLDF